MLTQSLRYSTINLTEGNKRLDATASDVPSARIPLRRLVPAGLLAIPAIAASPTRFLKFIICSKLCLCWIRIRRQGHVVGSLHVFAQAGENLEATGTAGPVVTLPDITMTSRASNPGTLLDIDLFHIPDIDLDDDFLHEFATPDALVDASWPLEQQPSSVQNT